MKSWKGLCWDQHHHLDASELGEEIWDVLPKWILDERAGFCQEAESFFKYRDKSGEKSSRKLGRKKLEELGIQEVSM